VYALIHKGAYVINHHKGAKEFLTSGKDNKEYGIMR